MTSMGPVGVEKQTYVDTPGSSALGWVIGIFVFIFVIALIIGIVWAVSRNNTTTGIQTIVVPNATPVNNTWSGWWIAGAVIGVIVFILIVGLIIWALSR